VHIRRFSGFVVVAIGLGLTAGAPGARAADSPLPPLVTTLETVADGAADVLTAAPVDPADAQKQPPAPVRGDNPRADITQASVEYAPGWIRLKVQVKAPTDPVKDSAWSDRSDAEWALDTNGDGKPEYTVEFAGDKGELYGAVFDVNKPDDKSLCDADSATFTPQDGYTLVIDPKCIGNPKSLGYSVGMFFATDAKNDNSPMATDRAPDQGFKVVAAPGQPADAAAPGPAVPAASGAPIAPNAAPSVSRGPAGAPARGPAAAPNRAAQAAPGTSPAPAAAPAPSDPAAPAAPLARTGSATETRGLFGLGIMLVGFGLVVMTRPTRLSLAK
jgi:hypothetical protein